MAASAETPTVDIAVPVDAPSAVDAAPAYAELHVLSSFSFLRGASQPVELVDQAAALGYAALALTDECSLAGIVRAHTRAKQVGLQLITGAEFTLACGLKLVVLAATRSGYGRLCRLVTRGRRAVPKGGYRVTRQDVVDCLLPDGRPTGGDCLLLWLPAEPADAEQGAFVATHFGGDAWLGVELHAGGRDRERQDALLALASRLGLPAVACGDVHMHCRGRRRLQDAVTAIRHRVPLRDAGWRLFPNGERHLRERSRLARLHPAALLAETLRIAARCAFTLDSLRYEYPRELVPEGHTPTTHLRQLAYDGARRRWPDGIPPKVAAGIEKELQLVAEKRYEPFFLTVHDVVEFARQEGILCQGRGSAANSVVCYCLGITAVDPLREGSSMLFERFVSRERDEPPDIDVDFEHQRREEVIQYLYRKYGRTRAALAATVISYRPRSAVRDLAMALDLDDDTRRRLATALQGWHGWTIEEAYLVEAGLDPAEPRLALLLDLAGQLVGFPRHLSQHVGGFVISEGLLEELVPIENASMPERTVIQWDKDDLEDLGLLKVDVLALGMLSAIRRAFDHVRDFHGSAPELRDVPPDDTAVYDMICRAETVGVFQIESRAQMSMLPRLRPRRYYDLVIEVAIVRPGPIQGDMVHPYLRRRNGEEPVTYPSEAVREVLERTLGVPIFQEQVMALAMKAAGFTPGEADQLRRSMAAWQRCGDISRFEKKLVDGLAANHYPPEFAQALVRQIRGFGEYGFPEAHAASFALLVYVSAWLKHHHPAAFTAGLLDSQPMGFYAPAQLLRDARRSGVELRAVDVCASDVECRLERRDDGRPALRLGLASVRSLPTAAAERLVAARRERAFTGVQDLGDRAGLSRGDLDALAAAGALRSLASHRHLAHWSAAAFRPSLPTAAGDVNEALPLLRLPTEGQDIVADYHALGFTLGRHPLALLRERLAARRLQSAQDLESLPSGASVRMVGLVVTRQRPHTASGVTFVTLEDETGQVNVIVWRQLGERQHGVLAGARLMEVEGELQREAGVTHVVASRLGDRSRLLGRLRTRSHDFH